MASYRLIEGTCCFYVVDEDGELQGSFDVSDVSTPDGEFTGLTESKARCNAEIFMWALKKADEALPQRTRKRTAKAKRRRELARRGRSKP